MLIFLFPQHLHNNELRGRGYQRINADANKSDQVLKYRKASFSKSVLTLFVAHCSSSHLGDGCSSAGLANPLSAVSEDDSSISAWISFTFSLNAFFALFALLKTTQIAKNLSFPRSLERPCHEQVT